MPEPCWIICPLVLLCWKQRNMVISEGLERDPCGFDLGVPWLFVLPLDGCLFYWVSGVSFIFGDRPFVRHVLCSVLFHSTCCLFILVIVSFAGQKPFHLMSCLSVCFCCLQIFLWLVLLWCLLMYKSIICYVFVWVCIYRYINNYFLYGFYFLCHIWEILSHIKAIKDIFFFSSLKVVVFTFILGM